MHVDLHFPALGESLDSDHGYDLYAALAGLVPRLHEESCKIRIGPIRGSYTGNGSLRLDSRFSRLRLRLAAEEIPPVLQLAGKAIDVGGNRLRLGVPQVRNLSPAPNVVARLVTIKGFTEPGPFLEAVQRQLTALGITGKPGIPQVIDGPRAGELRRRVIRVKDKYVIGFPMIVTGLAGEESIRLQESGLGGRAKMGCGFFGGMREDRA
ncbi:MAG TPA: type I-MYXAN CRISPR-associated protein Cas6/Cmx6 [Gemmataceae bacterium]|nr:type I-MYXAN CRISPR-associated protein Cas6/Cmx6 [Gemmataceae bacterium]